MVAVRAPLVPVPALASVPTVRGQQALSRQPSASSSGWFVRTRWEYKCLSSAGLAVNILGGNVGKNTKRTKYDSCLEGVTVLMSGWAAAHEATCADGNVTGGTQKPDVVGASPYSAEKQRL